MYKSWENKDANQSGSDGKNDENLLSRRLYPCAFSQGRNLVVRQLEQQNTEKRHYNGHNPKEMEIDGRNAANNAENGVAALTSCRPAVGGNDSHETKKNLRAIWAAEAAVKDEERRDGEKETEYDRGSSG